MITTSLTLSLVASIYLVVSAFFSANRQPGYSHVRQTISELAEYGSDHTRKVSLLVFLPVAILLGIVAWILHSAHPPIAALALSVAVGYGLSAIFPCDPGSPLTGSVRQAIHNLGGGIEYVGGAFSLLWISESTGPEFRVAGILVAASAILLSFQSRVRGIIQRIAETCLFASLLAALWMI
jgi:hypothetical protein